MGVKTQVVSLGDYRRKMLGGAGGLGGGKGLPGDYFSLGEFLLSLLSRILLFSLIPHLRSFRSHRRKIPNDQRAPSPNPRRLRIPNHALFRARQRPSGDLRREQRHTERSEGVGGQVGGERGACDYVGECV